jgi:hypothetical protein
MRITPAATLALVVVIKHAWTLGESCRWATEFHGGWVRREGCNVSRQASSDTIPFDLKASSSDGIKIAPIMMTPEGMDELVKAIRALGYDEETAERYAVFIGDTPKVDETGKTVVIDDEGRELARIDLRPEDECDALCEMDHDGFLKLVHEIQELGYDEETAAHYAALIGDMPTIDPADPGKIVVFDHGREVARLKLKSYG